MQCLLCGERLASARRSCMSGAGGTPALTTSSPATRSSMPTAPSMAGAPIKVFEKSAFFPMKDAEFRVETSQKQEGKAAEKAR